MHQSASSRAGAIAESLAVILIAAAVVGGPLSLGGAPAWAAATLQLVSVAAGLLWAWSGRRTPLWMLLPLALAALFGIQLLPMSDSLLMAIAPVSAGLWKVAHEGMPHAWGRTSVVPWETLAGVRQIVFGMTILIVVADLGRVERYRRWLLCSLACSGVMIAALACVFPRHLTGREAPRLVLGTIDLRGPIDFWKTPVSRPVETSAFSRPDWVTAGGVRFLVDSWVIGDPVGPYIDSNKFAGGMCLTMPIAVAVFLGLSRFFRLPPPAAAFLGICALAGGLWLIAGMAGSRAGGASFLFGGLMLATLGIRIRSIQRITLGATAAYLFTAAIFVGILLGPLRWMVHLFPEPIEIPLKKFVADGRVAAAAAAGRMFAASPVLGTGLGSYGYLQPYLLKDGEPLFFAHNDIVQLLAETGWCGVLVGVGFLSLVVSAFTSWLRLRPEQRAIADAGVWASFAAITMYSFFDWNLHLPGNAFLATLITGLALASGGHDLSQPASRRTKLAGIIASSLLSGILLWAAAYAIRDVESARVERQLRDALVSVRMAAGGKPPGKFPQEVVDAAVAAGSQMAAADKANALLSLLLGQLNLQLAANGDVAAKGDADRWFRKARLLCPPCSGLPELIPEPNDRRSRAR
jgi:hypothetical protein